MFQDLSVDDIVAIFTSTVLDTAKKFIPFEWKIIQKTKHPWLNENIMDLVCARRDAAGTSAEAAAVLACSKGIMKQFVLYSQHTCKALESLSSCSKAWWKKARELQLKQGANCSVPALKAEGSWHLMPDKKSFVDSYRPRPAPSPARTPRHPRAQ